MNVLIKFANRQFSRMSFPTRVLHCDPNAITFTSSGSPQFSSTDTQLVVETAAQILVEEKQVVVFPTETVYGLGASALDSEAVSRIFSTKGRPADNPLIVHVSSLTMLHSILPSDYTISRVYERLIERFWPGALTLLFPVGRGCIPGNVTANQSTVAVRMPSHPIARALIAVANTPLAAPSANSSGKPSPTRVEHVVDDLDGKVMMVLDGGPCKIGVESTVVDGLHQDGDLRILRPGGVNVEDIQQALQDFNLGGPIPQVLVHRRDYQDYELEKAPTTPGMKYRHYSPSVPVILLVTSTVPPIEKHLSTMDDIMQSLQHSYDTFSSGLKVGLMAPIDSDLHKHLPKLNINWNIYSLGPRAEPALSAANLFDGLLTLERSGVDVILIEDIQEEREGLAFMNRVRKAADQTKYLRL